MGAIEWLFEKPRRDYFEDLDSSESSSNKESFNSATSKTKRRDVTIMNLRVGDYVTYRSVDYYVRQRYMYRAGIYEWMAYQFSDSSKQKTLWLDVEDDDGIKIEMSEPIRMPSGVTEADLKAKKSFQYNNDTYEHDEYGYAQVRIENEDLKWDSTVVTYWDYYNSNQDKVISIEKWGNEELEATTGIPIKDYELEIYPGS